MTIQEIISFLKKNSSLENKEGMARFGINPMNAFGVKVPVLRALAKKIGKNHKLALGLWKTKIHEARILASMIDEPKEVTGKQMEDWVNDFDSWDLCDQCCMNLFDKMPNAWEKAVELAKKAVNWALRQIGKRNANLNKAAILVAGDIKKIDSAVARWIANDAIKELKSKNIK